MSKYLHSVVSAILLWLIGLLIVLIIKGGSIDSDLMSTNRFIAEMAENSLPGQRITAESLIKDMSGVDSESVEVISRDDAAKMMTGELPGLSKYDGNLFRDIIIFKCNDLSSAEIESMRKTVLDIQGVSGFFYEEDVFNGVQGGLAGFRMALIILSLVLLLAVIVVVVYALRHSFAERKDHIVSMFLAGATMEHIKKPYLISAVKKAIKAAVIAIILLVLNILLINRTLLSGIEVSFLQLILGAVILVVLSVVIYYSTTYSSTNTFLKKYKITQK